MASDDIVPAFPIRDANAAPELATALGDVILAWTWADRYLSQCLGAMLSLEDHKAKRIYFRIVSFDARIKMLLTLIDMNPDYEPIRNHISKLSSLSKKRNNFIHHTYLLEMAGDKIWQVDYGQAEDDTRRSKPTKANDMRQHADAVRNSTHSLFATLNEVPPYKDHKEGRLRRFLEAHRQQDS